MSTVTNTPGDFAAIDRQLNELYALLHMVKVLCNLEDRDVSTGQVDGTLADAATGLSVLMDDLADRVESIQSQVRMLHDLPLRAAAGGTH